MKQKHCIQHTHCHTTHTLRTDTQHTHSTPTLYWLVFEWGSGGRFCVNLSLPLLSVAQWVWHLVPVIVDLQLLDAPVDGSQQVLQILGVCLGERTSWTPRPAQPTSATSTSGWPYNWLVIFVANSLFTQHPQQLHLRNTVSLSQGWLLWFGLPHNTLTAARTPRLGLRHNSVTPARTPRLGLHHNTLTPAGTPRLY